MRLIATKPHRRIHRSTLPLVSAVLMVAALAGCGTRLHETNGAGPALGAGSGASAGLAGSGGQNGSSGLGGSSTSGLGGGGLGAAGTAGTGGGGGGVANLASGSSGGAGSSGQGGGTGSSNAVGGGPAAGTSSSRVLGVTATSVQIGYMYSDTATFAAFGAACSACATFGDETWYPAMFNVLANDLNKQGGILGRKVVFNGYPYNSTSAATDSSQLSSISQAGCQNFTTDSPSFAVISALGSVISPCLTRAGVSTVAQVGGIEDTVDNGPLGSSLLYEPGVTDTDDFMSVYLQRMAAQGYFSGWNTTTGTANPAAHAKIGLVSFSDPEFAHTDQIMTKDLQADGYKIADHIWYSAELDTQSQNVQNAIVKFRSEGITHVMGTGANGLFMYESVGQNYFPRYAYMTGSVSDTDSDSQKGMAGSMGEGVFPIADIDPSQNPPSVGALQTRCEQVATQAGVSWQSNQTFHADSLEVCDAVWDLVAAIEKSRTLTPAGLAAGFNGLGAINSPVNFQESWSSARHASAGIMEDFQFFTSCSCFRYTGVKTPF